MNKIAIFGDTALDLTFEIAKEYGIELIPYRVQMGDKNYIDQVDINTREFYQNMQDYEELKTATPPLQEVIDRLDKLKKEGYTDAIMISGSQKLTGMYNVYTSIKSIYEGINLHLFDTNQIASSAGLIVIHAARNRNDGKNLEEIITSLEKDKNNANIFALFRTLKYVVKGGRFNKYAGMLGNLLGIHPLLKSVDGEVGVIDKKRGKIRSQKALIDAVKKEIGNSKKYWMSIFSGDNDEEVKEIEIQLENELNNASFVLKTQLTPVLGVHAGPGSVGVSVLKFD